MSKRHHSNRRKNYGRRQHELHERSQRDHQPVEAEHALDEAGTPGMTDRLSFMDSRSSRLRYALGD
ncbi:MAG TPA: hypothetical protein VIZ22_12840 [Candidatus Limnocylindrales bacterium]